MAEMLNELVEAFLGEFYGENFDWRTMLDGETLALDATVNGNIGEVTSLIFEADGVRQIAAPQPFDSKRCVWALKQAIEKEGVS